MAGSPLDRPVEWGCYPRGGTDLRHMCGRKSGGGISRQGVFPLLCSFLLLHWQVLATASQFHSTAFSKFTKWLHAVTLSLSLPLAAHTLKDLQTRLHTFLRLFGIKPWLSFSRCLFEWQDFSFFFLKHWHMSHSSLPPTRQTQAFVSRFTSIQGLQSSPNVFLMKTAPSHHSVSV